MLNLSNEEKDLYTALIDAKVDKLTTEEYMDKNIEEAVKDAKQAKAAKKKDVPDPSASAGERRMKERIPFDKSGMPQSGRKWNVVAYSTGFSRTEKHFHFHAIMKIFKDAGIE
ncbi:hypothetical protein AgCh_027993 [Apium graveolens]